MFKRTLQVAVPTAATAALLVAGAPAASADEVSFQECMQQESVSAGPGGASAESWRHCVESSASTDDNNGGDSEESGGGLLSGLLGGLG